MKYIFDSLKYFLFSYLKFNIVSLGFLIVYRGVARI